MYCIKCGVKLADTEEKCPLCMTVVYHPDIERPEGECFYPAQAYPQKKKIIPVVQVILTALFLISAVVVIICDIKYSGRFTWSLYVLGALLLGYVVIVLPSWFAKPEPVVFVPCSFAASCAYLLLVNIVSQGKWFLSFAFPLCGACALVVTAVTVLLRFLKKGRLYVVSGAVIAFGGIIMLLEFLLGITFAPLSYAGWSLIPAAALLIIGLVLLFFAICRPARQNIERKIFF